MRALLIAVALLALAAPAAGAHVSVDPATAPAGAYARLDVRVPNERDDAGTVKVALQLPPGVIAASYEPVPGWRVRVVRERADAPIPVEGGFEVDEQVARITWTGGTIAPGQFREFGLLLRLPDGEAGDQLAFKALQTYDDGETVRWIGPPDADEPAAYVILQAATSGGQHGAAASTATTTELAAAVAPAGDDDGADALTIAALALGALGLLAGAAALMSARRGPREKKEAW